MEGSERKVQILEASARVFGQKGYFAASVSDIIEEAGVARGTFYLYFASKRQVFTEIMEQIIAYVRAQLQPWPSDATAEDTYRLIRDNIKRVFSYFEEHPDRAKIILTQAQGLDEESTRRLDRANYLLVEEFIRYLRRGQEMGLLHEFNVELAAVILLGGLKEILYHLVITRQIDAPLDVVADQLMRLDAFGILQPDLYPLLKEL